MVLKPSRKPRSDAQRNRERLLDAAKRVFARGGGRGASLEAVAAEAGLGIATLYRNFPSREALYEAVYCREVEAMAALARRLEDEPDPVDALRCWLRAMIDLMATKKEMVAALAITADATSSISARLSTRLVEALDRLLARAIARGAIRGDVSGGEMLFAMVGMCMMPQRTEWRTGALKMADVLVDGLLVAKPWRGSQQTG